MGLLSKKFLWGAAFGAAVVAAIGYGISRTEKDDNRTTTQHKLKNLSTRPTPQQAADYFLTQICAKNALRKGYVDETGKPLFAKAESYGLLNALRQAVFEFESGKITRGDAVMYFEDGLNAQELKYLNEYIDNYAALHPDASESEIVCSGIAQYANEQTSRNILEGQSLRRPIPKNARDVETHLLFIIAKMNPAYNVGYGVSMTSEQLLRADKLYKLGVENYYLYRETVLKNAQQQPHIDYVPRGKEDEQQQAPARVQKPFLQLI